MKKSPGVYCPIEGIVWVDDRNLVCDTHAGRLINVDVIDPEWATTPTEEILDRAVKPKPVEYRDAVPHYGAYCQHPTTEHVSGCPEAPTTCPGCGAAELLGHRVDCPELKKSVDAFNSRPPAVPAVSTEPPSKGRDEDERLMLRIVEFCAGIISNLSEENGRLKEKLQETERQLTEAQSNMAAYGDLRG